MSQKPRAMLIAERFNHDVSPGWNDWLEMLLNKIECALLTGDPDLPTMLPSQYLRRIRAVGAFLKCNSRAILSNDLGIDVDNEDGRFEYVHSCNLMPPSPRCGEWDARLALKVAHSVKWQIDNDYDLVVLCGRRLQAAFGIPSHVGFGYPYCLSESFEAARHGSTESLNHLGQHCQWVVIPHPSGKNHFWNNQSKVKEIREVFSSVLGSIEENLSSGKRRPKEVVQS